MKRITPKLTKHSRQLRKGMTDVEQLLWHKIRGRQLLNARFRRQHPLGVYIVDFICCEHKLIIELDGSQHKNQKPYDDKRDQWLTTQDYTVLRFWNNDVINNMEGILETIYHNLSSP